MIKSEFEELTKQFGLFNQFYFGKKIISVSVCRQGDSIFDDENPIIWYYNSNGHFEHLEDLLNYEFKQNLTLDEYIEKIDKIQLVRFGG